MVSGLERWSEVRDGQAAGVKRVGSIPMNVTLIPTVALLGLLSGSLAGGPPADPSPDGTNPLRINRSVTPIFPLALRQQGISRGEVTVVYAVNAEGRLEDVMPVAYTHRDFYDASLQAMKRWSFEPARNLGRAHPAIQFVTFSFEAGSEVVDMTAADALRAEMNPMRSLKDAYRIERLADLDAIPAPASIVSPGYPESLVGSGLEGEVTIEFYIDETGRVRMPALVEHTNLEFAAAAVDAVSRWTFEPPMRDGRPVTVLVRQRFHFNPPDEAG